MSIRSAVLALAVCLICEASVAQQPQPPSRRQVQTRPGQRVATVPQRGPVQNVPPLPNAPFVLDAAQQQQLDKVLAAWEKQSQQIDTLSCDFTRQEFSTVFGDPKKPTVTDGKLAYHSPDQADYQITTKGSEERWVCTGKSIFEFNYKESQLIERPLPPELQGKAIANGPLPFLFGVKAEVLKSRYWLRVVTPDERVKTGEVWLEAVPKRQPAAANFQRAWLILRPNDLVPVAVKIVLPNNDQTLHQFTNITVNGLWTQLFGGDLKPNTPLTWKYIHEDPPPSEPPAQGPPKGPQLREARRGR